MVLITLLPEMDLKVLMIFVQVESTFERSKVTKIFCFADATSL